MLLKIAQGVFWILAVCLMPGTAYGEGRDVLPGNAAYKVEVFRGGELGGDAGGDGVLESGHGGMLLVYWLAVAKLSNFHEGH